MRDPRLRQPGSAGAATERRAAAERLRKLPAVERTEIDRLLGEWWTSTLSDDATAEDSKTVRIADLRARLSPLPAGSLGHAAIHTMDPTAMGQDRRIGAILLGESAATAIRGGSSVQALDRAVVILSGYWEAIEVMLAALLDAPPWPSDPEDLAPSDDLTGLLGEHYERTPRAEVLIDAEKRARGRGLVAYLWAHHHERACLNLPTIVRLKLLAARDWDQLALQAEALPLRELKEDVWRYLHLSEDRDAIRSLLGAAPPVFDAGGWTGNTAAMAALGAAVDHADQLHANLSREFPAPADADRRLAALVKQESPSWMAEVAALASARSDGRELLLAFAAHLIRKQLQPRWSSLRSWSSGGDLLDAIYAQLSPGPTITELQELAVACGAPANRSTVDHGTYLVTAAALRSSPVEVWTWYRELLRRKDDDLCWQAQNWSRSCCYSALAERLRQLPSPLEEWRLAWRDLFVTDREKARFARQEHHALQPSLHLLRVGAELLRQAPFHTGAKQFFEELQEHRHRLVANDPRLVPPSQQTLALEAIDLAPAVLGPDWPRALDPYRPLLSSARNRLYVAACLLEGGAVFGEVEAAVEVPPRRLVDSVAEVKRSRKMDMNSHRLIDVIETAAKAAGHRGLPASR